jgi:hypothetical protein
VPKFSIGGSSIFLIDDDRVGSGIAMEIVKADFKDKDVILKNDIHVGMKKDDLLALFFSGNTTSIVVDLFRQKNVCL